MLVHQCFEYLPASLQLLSLNFIFQDQCHVSGTHLVERAKYNHSETFVLLQHKICDARDGIESMEALAGQDDFEQEFPLH